MRKIQSLQSKLNEARMLVSKRQGDLYLVVEGADEVAFFRNRIVRNRIHIVDACGWKNVVQFLKSIKDEGLGRLVGLVDRDFLDRFPKEGVDENVVVTDFFDFEWYLLKFSKIDYVIQEYGSDEKLRSCQIGDFRKRILEISAWISGILFYTLEKGMGLDVSELKYDRFVDRKSFDFDRDALFRYVFARSDRHDLLANITEHMLAVEKIVSSFSQKHECCVRGKDIVGLTAFGLCGFIGSQSGAFGRSEICSPLRISMNLEEMEKQCNLISNLKNKGLTFI